MIQSIKSSPSASLALIVAAILATLLLWQSISAAIFPLLFLRLPEQFSPLTLYRYWWHYGSDPEIRRALGISSGVGAAPIAFFAYVLIKKAPESLFGAARFATWLEIWRAGLFGEEGIILGRIGKRYVRSNLTGHVAVVAPTQSGKSVGAAIPNAKRWKGSLFVLDMKGEIHAASSGERAKYSDVFVFAPLSRDYRSDGYNPFSFVPDDPVFRIVSVQGIGDMLYPDKPKTDPIWTATPRSLFVGLALYLMETPGKIVSIGQMLREVSVGDGAAALATIINERAAGDAPLSNACVRALNAYISIDADPTRAGIIGAFRAALAVFDNPLVDAATTVNSIPFDRMRHENITVYLCVEPPDLPILQPLLNLLIKQVLAMHTRVEFKKDPALKHRMLWIMDEFCAMGAIPSLVTNITYLASYGIRLLTMFQTAAQLVPLYGKEEAGVFLDNHTSKVVFAPNADNAEGLQTVSTMLGFKTVKGRSVSTGTGWLSRKEASQSESDQKRALMWPDEINHIVGLHRIILVCKGCRPFIADAIRFYQEKYFMASALPPTTTPVIDIAAHRRLIDDGVPLTVRVPGAPKVASVVVVATPAHAAGDITKLAFVTNFSPMPPGNRADMDINALLAYADMRSRESGLAIAPTTSLTEATP